MNYIYKDYHKKISDEELLGDLKTAAKALGKNSITQNEYSARGRFSVSIYKDRFGGWHNAAEMAGLKVKRRKKATQGELLYDLKLTAKKAGRDTLMAREYESLGNYSHRQFKFAWGSWNASLKAAGLKPSRQKKWTAEELLEEIRRVWDLLKRQPRTIDMEKHASVSVTTYINHFNSLQNALKEFVQCNSKNVEDAYMRPLQKQFMRPVQEQIASAINENGVYVHKTSRYISVYLRYKVLLRDSFRCVLCGRSPANEIGVALHVDHIKPWSLGGETEYDNLRALCKECNLGRNVTQFYDCGEQT